MPSTEEDILLLLLPQLQGRLDFIALKPHLKLSCSLTEEECQLLFKNDQNMPDSSTAHVLVKLLRGKAPHCCARMLLNALKQSQKNKTLSDHTKIIELLHVELQSMSRELSQVTSKHKGIYTTVIYRWGFQKVVYIVYHIKVIITLK